MQMPHIRSKRSTTRRRVLLAVLGAVVAAGLATMAIGLSTATATSETTVEVKANKEWTDTGLALTAGEKVTITATGKINANPAKTAPVGAKFQTKECGTDAYGGGFTAPGVNCWSLLFRIGNTGVPFPTGSKITFTAPVAGELELGINDNVFIDNSGSFTAVITTP